MTADIAGEPARDPEARLARIHVRTGLVALARAELETMAGAGSLDTPALADLAEVRWRTGDLVGAGEAAFACLDAGGQDPVVLCIAAEAAYAAGRPGDARALVERVLTGHVDALDDLFAGQPRCELWPPPRYPSAPRAAIPAVDHGRRAAPPDEQPARPRRAARPARSREGLRDGTGRRGAGNEAGATGRGRAGRLAGGRDEDDRAGGPGPGQPFPDESAADVLDREGLPAGEPPVTRSQAPAGFPGRGPGGSAAAELARAQALVSAGRLDGLATRLALVLRTQPVLAPAVLAVADQALSAGAPDGEASALHIVRGDAYRLMGRETSAREAFQLAGGSLADGEAGNGDTGDGA